MTGDHCAERSQHVGLRAIPSKGGEASGEKQPQRTAFFCFILEENEGDNRGSCGGEGHVNASVLPAPGSLRFSLPPGCSRCRPYRQCS